VRRRILVIRLGALGDMALSFPAFAAIRAHHARDHLTLLTTQPYAELARACPWFDDIRLDSRPGWFDLPGLWRLRRQLAGFDLVYDLQTSRRSSRYFRLAGRPAWSGIAYGCSLPDANPDRDRLHTIDRQRCQLEAAGVPPAPVSLDWLRRRGPVLDGRYALLVPGTSGTHGGGKRWPVACFSALAGELAKLGLRPVVIGTRAEGEAAAAILHACPDALDLTGRTSILDLAGLSGRAALAIGGDTGPIHLAAVMGCRVLTLFSRFSDPVLAAPVGAVRLLQANRLEQASVPDVLARLKGRLGEADWLDCPPLPPPDPA
jgi:ADP-heptose:LPS heptosyltransferase